MKKDWVSDELGNIFFSTSGGTPSRGNHDYYKGSIPWVKSGELDKGVIFDTEEKISEEAVKNSSAKIFPKGTLLIALYGATIGKLAFLGVEAATNQAICGIFKNDYIDSKFLYNFLLLRRPKLISQGTGGAQPNISQTILKKLDFPFPSKQEQRAIVLKIENLFASLDKGIADLKTAQEQLKVYRQAVLKKAFEGGFTCKDGQQSVSTEENNNLPEGWKWVKLGDCGDWKGGGTPSISKREFWENGHIPWVSSSDVKNKEIHDTERHITEVAISNSSTKWIEKNSLIFVMRSGILRRVFPVSIAKVRLCVNQDIQTLSLTNSILPEYAYWFVFGNEANIRHNCSKDGTTVESIDSFKLKKVLIPIPSTKEQKLIIKEIESRLSVCDKVEQSITEALEKAEALRQSILKKAFEGALLSEDEISKCKQEADYEPAATLLERIKQNI